MANHFLDARHLLCPMPVIRVQNRIADLNPGEILEVVTTDPGALMDIPTWVKVNGHRLLEVRRVGHETCLVIEVVS